MTPRKTAYFALGPLGSALLGVITVPIITWFFSQEDVGRMAMLQVILSFSTLLFSLGLDQAYVREFHESSDRPVLLKMAVLPGLVLLMLTFGGLLVFGGSLSEWLFDVSALHLSLTVAVALLATFISRFLSLILRMHERGLAFSMSQLLPKLVLLLIVGTYVLAGADKSLTNLVVANTASIVLVCLLFVWNTRREWRTGICEPVNTKRLGAMLRFGLPLIFGGLAFWGLTATDKVLIRTLSSYQELGLYSVAVSFAAAGTILQSVFSTVWAPTVYRWASQGSGLENIHRVSRYVLLCVVVLFCLAGLFSWVLTYLLPDNYARVRWIVIACFGYPLLYSLSETTVVGIGIVRRSSFAMVAAIIAFIVNVVGNWWLIPSYGAAGAAAGTCVAFLVFFVLRTEFSIYVWRRIPRFALYGYAALLTIGATVSALFGEVLIWLTFVYWGGLLISTLVVFRSELISAMRWVKRRLYERKKAGQM